MKRRHYRQSPADIVEAASDIERFMAGVNLERLTGDRKTLFAVAKALVCLAFLASWRFNIGFRAYTAA